MWCLLLISLLLVGATEGRYPVPTDSFTLPGDVYLGSLIYLHDRLSHSQCNSRVSNVYGIQMHMAEVWALETVNADPSLLGNIKLGYTAKEECFIGFMSVGQTLEYLGILGVNSSSPGGPDGLPPVVGVMGPLGTISSMGVSNLYSLYQTPHISPTATSDTLSDRGLYPYFYRTVPPDSFQTRVMMDTLHKMNWTYVSVVHDDGNFGYNAIKLIRRLARDKSMCIADSYPVDDEADAKYFYRLVGLLMAKAHYGSHGVILFLSPGRAKLLMQTAAQRYDNTRRLYFFHSADTAWITTFEGLYDLSVGSLGVTWPQQQLPELQEYLRALTPNNYPDSPFLRDTWDDLAGCGATKEEERVGCYNKTLGDLDYYFPVSDAVQSALGVQAFALAIDGLVRDLCPQALTTPALASACVTPPLVATYLKRVKIPQPSTPGKVLSFNENGEIIGDYRVKQLQHSNGVYSMQEVGVWPQEIEDIELDFTVLQWTPPHSPPPAGNNNVNASYKINNSEKQMLPESLCAKPCAAGEIYIQGELSCCWECRRCRDNEYVTNNLTSCDVCPYLTWPEDVTFSECLRIPASYLNWSDMYGICLLALAGCGFLVTMVILEEVLRHRNRRVIKGAVLDMLLTVLAGICLAFCSIPLYILPASQLTCIIARVTFSASCTFIFGPVFVKTQLVYHVFAATERFKRSAKMAKTHVKVSLTVCIFVIQAALISVSMVFYPVTAEYRMPVRTERYVELQCDQELEGLLLPLSYNIFLVLLCSIFAFLTRKLPDNFNESWYIFITVSTTLFIWVAFLPTYFSAFYAYHKAALLALALVLNGTVTIFCLFSPKVYALYYVPDKDIKVSDFRPSSFSSSVNNKTSVSVVS